MTAALAFLAGGEVATAIRLGLAMTALQASIGALNDVTDAERDRDLKPGKPIPRGLVTLRTGRALVVLGLLLGLGLAAPSGPPTVAVALAGAGCGYLYDLRLKGTPLSWAPFAAGIPLLPVFAWVGAVGRLPAAFAVLIPVAVVAGAALAIANALADVERDRAAGVASVAVHLGERAAWRVHAVLQVTVIAVAFGALAALGGRGPGVGLGLLSALVILAGVGLSGGGGPGRRERAWELEVLGVGALAAGWVLAVS